MADEKIIALVIYDGLTALDLVGPLQVLTAMTAYAPNYRVTVVAEKIVPITSDNGMTFIPNQTFDAVRKPFMLFLPGGGEPTIRAMFNEHVRAYVRSAAETAEFITSTCTGALILAGVGLLKGKRATTHWAFYQILNQLGATYQRQRWVEDGKFITTAGVSAGIDGALYMVSRLTNEETARCVQLDLHYEPQPPFGRLDYARLDIISRLLRASYSLRAPFIANRANQLTAQAR